MTRTTDNPHDREIVVPTLVPHMSQYFGIWMMADPAFSAMLAHVNTLDLGRHIRANQERATRAALASSDPQDGRHFELLGDDLAMIDIVGTMTKYGSSLSEMQRGTIGVRQSVRAALADSQIKGILLRIDSPGGAVAGLDDLATDVHKAAQQKPVHAFCEDLCASAAYYVASQANQVISNASAMVGAIGTFAVLYDYSESAARDGIEVHVIRAGEFKGAGTAGTKITPEQLAEFQRMVDTFSALFVAAVARGRKITEAKAKQWNDGAVHIGVNARALGLVDAVQDFDEAVAGLRAATGRKPKTESRKLEAANRHPKAADGVGANNKETLMTTDNNTPPAEESTTTSETTATATPEQPTKAATFQELKAALPNATAEFREQCLGADMTLAAAQTKYTEHLEARAETAEEKANQAAAAAKMPGVDALGDGVNQAKGGTTDLTGDPIAAWDAAVAELMKTPMTKAVAVKTLVHKDPEMHDAYLAAYNAKHPPHDDLKKR